MAEVLDVSLGKWWRFSAYEIREGFIRPAPGAKLTVYDPWEEYRQAFIRKNQEG